MNELDTIKLRAAARRRAAEAAGQQGMAVGKDMARSGLRGLADGAIGFVGSIGDAVSNNEGLARGAAQEFNAPEWVQDAVGTTARYMAGPFANAPTSAMIADPIKNATRPDGGQSFMEYEAKTTPGSWTQTAGELIPGSLLGPGSWFSKAGAVLGGTAGGETLEAIAPESWKPYAKALGMVLGGGFGSGAGEFASLDVPKGMTRKSAALLRSTLPDDNFANFQKLGPEARLLDAGPSTVGIAQGVAQSPGKSADEIVNALLQREGGRSDRLRSGVKSTLGRAQDPERLKKAVELLAQRKAGPIYKDAIANAPPLSPRMEDILSRTVESTLAPLSEQRRMGLMKLYDKLDDALNPSANGPDPSLTAARVWDLRKELDAKIVYSDDAFSKLSSAEKTMQSVYKDMRGTVDDILKNRIPGFDKADPIIAAGKKAADDIDFGYKALEGGKSAVHPDSFRREMRKRGGMYVDEGIKADIDNAMGTQANDLLALRKRVGGENDFNRAKLAQRFGQGKVDEMVNMIDSERQMAQNYADIDRGSQTARRSAAGKLVDGTDAPRFSTQDTLVGLGVRGAEKIVNSFVKRAAGKMAETNKQALAQALLKQGPEALALMQALAKLPSPTSTALVQALLAVNGSTSGARVGTGQMPLPAGR